MKITGVKLSVLQAPAFANRLFDLEPIPGMRRTRYIHRVASQGPGYQQVMHVLTDEGVEGVCTVAPIGSEGMSKETLEQLRHLVVGEDALDREKLYQKLHTGTRWIYREPGWAGAFDNCLWDIAGKVANLPVCALLGRVRDRIPVYMNIRGATREEAAADAQRIVQARAAGPFRSVEELAVRSGLGRAALALLAKAGALGSLAADRRQALWQALAQARKPLPLLDQPLLEATGAEPAGSTFQRSDVPKAAQDPGDYTPHTPDAPLAISPVALPKMSAAEEVLADYRATGLSLRGHPLRFLRAALEKRGIVPAEKLKDWPDGKPVAVAGIVLVRQRPATAKGITFMTLEDETGIANLLVRPRVWQRFRAAALRATVLLAWGRLQRQGEVVHVVVAGLEDLSDRLAELPPGSRDFC